MAVLGDPRHESGQALILMVLAATCIFAIGAIVIDFGLWFTERRGAQKDADAAALAGAFELLRQDFINFANNDSAAIQAAAEQAAYQWADFNGLPSADVKDLLVDDTDCLGPSPVVDTVSLAAEHHSRALFGSIFGVVVPEIGAPAKACLGSISSAEGLLPVGIQIAGRESDCWRDLNGDGFEDPIFGQECVLTFGASDQTSGEAGNLRLYNDGSLNCSGSQTGGRQEYVDEVEGGGANTQCHVYKYFPDLSRCDDDPGGCVYPLTGVGSNPEMQAFNDLLSKEGTAGYDCDVNFGNSDGIDELLEVAEVANGEPWPSGTALFSRRDCTSPRLVSLIIVSQFSTQGNPPLPIEAFASFFIKGCETVDQNNNIQFSAKCDPKDFNGRIGQFRLRGYFINLLEVAGAVGHISKWSPKRIILVE